MTPLSEHLSGVIEAAIPDAWLIWSNEHAAYWAPNKCGYRKSRADAGRFSFREAAAICDRAGTRRFGHITLPSEIVTPSDELIIALEQQVKP